MNKELVNWIWNHSKADDSLDLLVLLALAQNANVLGEATVKLSELARLCRCSEGEVRVSLRAAVKLNEIEIFQNTNADGARLTNTYKFSVYAATGNGETEQDDISFEAPPLPGIPVPKLKDPSLPKPPPPKLMMDDKALAAIAADPTYQGMNVYKEAWRFKRWCVAKERDQTVRAFKVWLSKV